jgi:hypothetical protein
MGEFESGFTAETPRTQSNPRVEFFAFYLGDFCVSAVNTILVRDLAKTYHGDHGVHGEDDQFSVFSVSSVSP